MFKTLRAALFDNPTKVEEHEIVPGTDKPTVILVNMICSRMIVSPKGVDSYRDGKSTKWSFTDTTDGQTVRASMVERRREKEIKYECIVTGYDYDSFTVAVGRDDEFVLMNSYETEPLKAAFKKADVLKGKLLLQEAENARQDAALMAIEKLTVKKPPPKTLSEPDKEAACDCNEPEDCPNCLRKKQRNSLTPIPPCATRKDCERLFPFEAAVKTHNGWYPESQVP